MNEVSRACPALGSALNPNATPFVPLAYRTVEDFSDQWWALVQSSPWFRDYWLQERFSDPQDDSFDDLVLPDLYSFYDLMHEEEDKEEEEYCRDLLSTGGLMNWRKARAEKPRHAEKVPKIVNLKMMPRTIQQPR